MIPLAIVLLLINAGLVLTIIIVLRSFGAQSRRVARIAQEAHDLAERAERHIEETAGAEKPKADPANKPDVSAEEERD